MPKLTLLKLIGAHNTTRDMGWFIVHGQDENEIAEWAGMNPHMIFFILYVTTEIS